jgi:hypothetical protein
VECSHLDIATAWEGKVLCALRQLNNNISKTINAWEEFNDGSFQYFRLPPSDPSATRYGRYLATIDKQFRKLGNLRSSLLYEQEFFEDMINVSSLSRNVIRLLTRGRQIAFLTMLCVGRIRESNFSKFSRSSLPSLYSHLLVRIPN